MRVTDGRCRFSVHYSYDIDTKKQVQICNVLGCGICDVKDTCLQCYDPIAELSDDGTVCKCPEGTIFNDDEKCVTRTK